MKPFKPGYVFWGKYLQENQFLSLTAHCLDVALVFRALCNLNSIQRSLAKAAENQLTEEQLDRLAVLAMLHDIGKANLGFQQKVFNSKSLRAGHIRELAPLLDFDDIDIKLYEAFSQSLPPEMATWFSDEKNAYSYLMASFSHHGQPLYFQGKRAGTYWHARDWWHPQNLCDPMSAIADIIYFSRKAFPKAFEASSLPLPAKPHFHHRFAGLVILADWLGSHQSWFPIQQVQLEERLQNDQEIIPLMLKAVGLDTTSLRPVLTRGPQDFKGRFTFSPRPLQAVIDDLQPDDEKTNLVIAESETGSGKTEAALNWFFKLFMVGKVDSLYFALPTRVAAQEIYRRVKKTMERLFPDPSIRPVTVLAVPGYAQVDGLSAKQILAMDEECNRWQDDETLRQRERMWAAEHPKRFLAATVAVGTIDQALLSTVQTAHAHLRSVCLDRSLLVVDEVHASDFYMSRLLEFLLKHHLSVGGRAMLLSATLGASARHRYVSATCSNYSLPELTLAQNTAYPAITFSDGVTQATDISYAQNKMVHFEEKPYAFKPEAIVSYTMQTLAKGARVLVVLNTVDRVNTLLRSLENHPDFNPLWFFKCRDVICPHHGRFSPADRELLDARVSECLGPNSPPGPLLLVGTQTLEQSLDIDSDLMISDLAPADVLLQRVGRLHRHERTRPSGFETPRCILLTPESDLENALDKRGHVISTYKRIGYGSVYEDLRTLELTRRALSEKPDISIPEDNRWLVEAVTHSSMFASLEKECWMYHGQYIEGCALAEAIAAGNAVTIYDKYFGEFEFNEAGGKVTVRLGADSLRLRLNKPVTSPFGQTIHEIVIPGHLAPEQPEEVVNVEDIKTDVTILRCANRYYHYSRYGLEEAT